MKEHKMLMSKGIHFSNRFFVALNPLKDSFNDMMTEDGSWQNYDSDSESKYPNVIQSEHIAIHDSNASCNLLIVNYMQLIIIN